MQVIKLSVKKSFEQKINSHKFLAGGLVGCSILSPMCCLSAAYSVPITTPAQTSDTKHTYIPRTITDQNTVLTTGIINTNWRCSQRELHKRRGCTLQVSPPETQNSFSIAEFSPSKESSNSPLSLETQIINNNEVPNSEPVAPQPSVDQLADIQPTDWAYQALKSLVERYGVISGYTDNTFRGARSVTRHEFASALLATLDNLDRLTGDISEEFLKSDAVVARRLQREFAQDLQELRLRTHLMEQRANRLQAQQFSPTTKLQGESIFAFTDGNQASTTVISRTRLNLNTSFQGKDLLVTQLEVGNNGTDAIAKSQQENLNLLGTDGLIANGGGLDIVGVKSGVRLRRLYYSFRPARDVEMVVGAKMSPRDFIDRNSYANNEGVDFSSSFFLNNPLIVQNQIDGAGGAGVAIVWHPDNSKLSWRSLYIAADADKTNGNSNGGLFGDRYQASMEVEYLASNNFSLKLQFTNALVNNTDINAFGINAEYAFNQNTGIFTRLGFGSYQGFNTAIGEDLDLHPVTWALGVGFRNLLIPGSVAGIAVGQPFVTSGLGNATQTNFEVFYNLSLKENFSITPTFSLVTNPDNDRTQDTIWQTTLRTVISF